VAQAIFKPQIEREFNMKGHAVNSIYFCDIYSNVLKCESIIRYLKIKQKTGYWMSGSVFNVIIFVQPGQAGNNKCI
jgi:hypothetical protein